MDAQTIRTKLNTVPLELRDWFSSEEVVDLVKKINDHFNISGTNRNIIPRLLLRLEIQDLEAEYFAGELSEELKIDRDKAIGITAEVKRGVVAPLKKSFSDMKIDIADMDKFQVPIIKNLRPDIMPKMVSDIAPAPVPVAPKVTAPTAPTTPSTPKPVPLPQTTGGWSQVKPPSTVPPKPAASSNVVGEFARLGVNQKAPAAGPAEPAPFMLHQDSTFQPLQTKNDFRLSKPDSGASMNMGSQKPQAPVPKPAILEFEGKAPAPKPQVSAMTHYTELLAGSAKPAQPPVTTGPRNITEVTSAPTIPATSVPPPLPPQAPRSVQPVQPAAPPQAPQGKIVSKDYL